MPLQRQRTDRMADKAYHQILDLLASEEIDEADIISHRDLAQKLGMSKMPIGGALRRLEREGLVEMIPRIGTRVCRVDAQSMWDMIQWRIALECQTARLACEWMDAAGAERLMAAARQVDQLFAKDPVRSFQPDVEFHLLLADLCGCPRLRRELDRLNIYRVKLLLCESVSAAALPAPAAPRRDHQILAQAVIKGPPERAEQRMREHLERGGGIYGFVQWYRKTHLSAGKQ